MNPVSSWTREAYDALAQLNHRFVETIDCMDHMEKLHMIPAIDLVQVKARVEHERAALVSRVMETLQTTEQESAARYDYDSRELEQASIDPDDVLVAARQRRHDILDQIRAHQRSIARGRATKVKHP